MEVDIHTVKTSWSHGVTPVTWCSVSAKLWSLWWVFQIVASRKWEHSIPQPSRLSQQQRELLQSPGGHLKWMSRIEFCMEHGRNPTPHSRVAACNYARKLFPNAVIKLTFDLLGFGKRTRSILAAETIRFPQPKPVRHQAQMNICATF